MHPYGARSALRRMGWLCLVAVASPGCSAAVGDLWGPGGGSGPGGKEDGAEARSALAPAYAFLAHSEGELRNRTTGELRTSVSELLGVVTTRPADTQTEFSLRACRALLPKIGERAMLLPDAALQRLPPAPFTGSVREVEPEGDESAVQQQLETEPGALLGGASLANRLDDALPVEENDTRVYDADGDDRPGITVDVGGYNVWGAMRLFFQLRGAVEPSGEILGSAEMTNEFAIFDDDIWFVSARDKQAESIANTEVLARQAHFRMIPMTDEVSCDAAINGYF